MRVRLALTLAIALLLNAFTSPALATSPRTFVASTGSDVNVCSLAHPCRSFAAAQQQTSAGGEIIVLDSAGYGIIDINRSISIVAPDGIYAGITVPDNQIGVLMTAAGLKVTLRGLTINGQGTGSVGINFSDGAELHVERCIVANLGASGLESYAGRIYVQDTSFRSNGGAGLFLQGPEAHLDRVQVEGSGGNGVSIFSGAVFIHDSHIEGNAGIGVMSSTAKLMLSDSSVEANGDHGVQVHDGLAAIVRTVVARNLHDGVDILATLSSPLMVVDFDAATISSNGISGIYAKEMPAGVLRMSIARSTVSSNGQHGVHVQASNVAISQSNIHANAFTGIVSDPGAVTVQASAIMSNGFYGVRGISGYVYSTQNNLLFLNSPTEKNGNVTIINPW